MLEKAIKELFRVMPKEEVYFSRKGEYSITPSQDNFLKTHYDPKIKVIHFEFEKNIDWEKVEEFYVDENNFLSVEFVCDSERFSDLATEYHTLSPPVDETIMDYELRITKEDEVLEIVSEGPYSLTFYVCYENKKTGDIKNKVLKVKKTEEKINEELKRILDKQKKSSHKRPEKDVITAVVKTPKEKLENLLKLNLDEEEVALNYDEMQERIRKVRDIMLKMPITVKKGLLKINFEYTSDCKLEYCVNKDYGSTVDLYRDINIDWEKDTIHTGSVTDIFGLESVGFDIEYQNGKCKVRGRVSTELLGEGLLEEFLNKFNA
ncbi:hypothetical protein HY837_06815 [archaeon]|nr:hypothetical protein [archaeon]